MINMLIDELPQKVGNIDINSDFRVSILFELLMQDNDYTNEEKVQQALILYYPNLQEIDDYNKAIENIIWFYKCGKEDKDVDKGNKKNNNNKQVQIYSYEFDAEYIYSAFMEQYKIDLNSIEYLHWWKFKAMFNGLKSDNRIVEIMGNRAMNLSKIKDKEERKRCRKLQKLYALPDMRTQEQKESDFACVFL